MHQNESLKMARKRVEFSGNDFDVLYNKLTRGIITQHEMAAELGISRATLVRRLYEHRQLPTESEARTMLFKDAGNCPFVLNAANVGDGLTLLGYINSDAVSAVIFDPEYRGVLDHLQYANEGADGTRQFERTQLPQMTDSTISDFAQEISRILKPSGHCFIWADAYSISENIIGKWIEATPLQKVDLIVWDKCLIGSGSRSRRRAEYLTILQKPPIIGHWTDHGIPDIWQEKIRRTHPHSKPTGLLTRLIRATTKPGDFIVDPAAGGYSSLKACQEAGERFYIGCDLLPFDLR